MNARFSEYVTSGAFSMTLTRSQISTLAMLAAAEPGAGIFGGSSLERKGLAEPIASSIADDRVEWRITGAGAICLSLLCEAGLTNHGKDAAASEIDSLRAALEDAHRTIHDVSLKARSMHAKLQAAEYEIEDLKTQLAASESERAAPLVRLKPEAAKRASQANPCGLRLRLRDPLPDVPAAELLAGDSNQPERNRP